MFCFIYSYSGCPLKESPWQINESANKIKLGKIFLIYGENLKLVKKYIIINEHILQKLLVVFVEFYRLLDSS